MRACIEVNPRLAEQKSVQGLVTEPELPGINPEGKAALSPADAQLGKAPGKSLAEPVLVVIDISEHLI